MKQASRIPLGWDRFKVTGDICPIRLGMPREEIRAIFGDPEYSGGTSRKYPTPAIWKYGDLEFHFGPKRNDQLNLIYMERDEVVRVSISVLDRAG